MSATTKTNTKVRISYTLRETHEGSSLVTHSGCFEDYDTAITTIAQWEPAAPGVTRTLVKRTYTVVTTSTEEETSYPLI